MLERSKVSVLLLLSCLLLNFNAGAQSTISYHPNGNWTLPGTLPTTTKYLFRSFAPQYAFPTDFSNGEQDRAPWLKWMQENSFVEEHPLVGHSYQVVIANHKEVFQQYPEYLAELNGVRVGYGKTTKFCFSNRALQRLYVKDRLEAFEKGGNPSGSVSVEPSDGGGFCTCEGCRSLGSVSNGVFMLANLTAKAIREKYPQGKVNLYAYHKHMEVPDFELEPNVHVAVVPNGFQTVYEPEEALIVWAEKANLKSFYEYFVIPQHKGEQPRFHMHSFLQRMQLAKEHGYIGYRHEVGLNLPAAISLQLYNQLWLDSASDWETLTNDFIVKAFPKTQTPIKRLFNRWWFNEWDPAGAEIGFALYDLQEASKYKMQEAERERIRDLKAYVHYLALYQEWSTDKKNAAKRTELFDYVFRSSSRMIVNPSALVQIFDREFSEEEKTKYRVNVKKNWDWVQPLTHAEIEKNFKNDSKRFSAKRSDFIYIPIESTAKAVFEKYGAVNTVEVRLAKLADKVQVYVPESGVLEIELVQPKDIATQNDERLKATVISDGLELIYSGYIDYTAPILKLQLPAAGIYTIALQQYFSVDLRLRGAAFTPVLNTQQVKSLESIRQQDKYHIATSGLYHTLHPKESTADVP